MNITEKPGLRESKGQAPDSAEWQRQLRPKEEAWGINGTGSDLFPVRMVLCPSRLHPHRNHRTSLLVHPLNSVLPC